MNYKLATTLIIVLSIGYIAPQKLFVADNYDEFEYNCNLILSAMHFLYNQRCVQFIFSHELLYSVECIKKIMENSENVTFYLRSLPWLLNRNIFVEESSANIIKKKSTKYCENFLILLKDLSSLQSVLNNVSVVTFFPYTKLYVMLVDKHFQFTPPRLLTEISKFFYENAQFGYVYEVDAATKTTNLRNFLTLNVESSRPIQSNLIHPFVNRENTEKEFRLTFYNCSPFIIYVDEENLR